MLTKINRRFRIRIVLRSHALLITLFIVAVAPIIIASSVNAIENKHWYYHNFYDMDAFDCESSNGCVKVENEKIVMGNLSFDNPSNITMMGRFYERPFIGQEALNATSASLEIGFELPLTTYLDVAKEIGWTDDNFTSGWTLYARTGEGSATISNGTLDVFANFEPNSRDFHLLRKDLPGINTTAFPYFFVKWRSTDHVARLDLYGDSEDEFKVILDSADGNIYSGTYGGGYSEYWLESLYQLPPGENITRLVLGVDSGGGAGGPFPVSGIQHAYFDYVQFAKTTIAKTSYIRIDLNNQTIFNENLIYPVQPGIYSLNPTSYSTRTLSIPINANRLDVDNSIFISIGPETVFNITSIRVAMNTYPENVTPAWHATLQKTGILYVLVVGDVFITVLMIKRLLKWLKSLDADVKY